MNPKFINLNRKATELNRLRCRIFATEDYEQEGESFVSIAHKYDDANAPWIDFQLFKLYGVHYKDYLSVDKNGEAFVDLEKSERIIDSLLYELTYRKRA